MTSFSEKPQIETGWINGGFFVLEPGVLDYIAGDETKFERPAEFIIDRFPNLHQAFGLGAHFCIGAITSCITEKN